MPPLLSFASSKKISTMAKLFTALCLLLLVAGERSHGSYGDVMRAFAVPAGPVQGQTHAAGKFGWSRAAAAPHRLPQRPVPPPNALIAAHMGRICLTTRWI